MYHTWMYNSSFLDKMRIYDVVWFCGGDYPDKIMDCDLFFFQYRNRHGKACGRIVDALR